MIRSFNDLDVYKLSYRMAMDIFDLTKNFPSEEKFSLTSQVIRASRSVSANIAEGYGKRTYENEFRRHLIYSTGSLEECKVWLKFALDCKYISTDQYETLDSQTREIGAKLFKLYQNWRS